MREIIRGRVLSLPTVAYTRLGGQIVGVSVSDLSKTDKVEKKVRQLILTPK